MEKDELDILSIDNEIRKKFEEEKNTIHIYKNRLHELEKTYKNKELNVRCKKVLKTQIQELQERIDDIESNNNFNFYISDTQEILKNYIQILKTPLKMSFVNQNQQEDRHKKELIAKYINTAKKYYSPIKSKLIERKESKTLRCCYCNNTKDFDTEENNVICMKCGTEQNIVLYNSSYKDVDRVNVTTKYTYERRVHFRERINKYQGKQNCTINQKVYDELEKKFERHHLLVGDKNTKKEIRFSKITKEHILMFLKELGYSKHYENVILIHYNLTGIKPDDISHLEDKLMDDFDQILSVYDKKFKGKIKRRNFISTQYVLYQLLQKYGHPCNEKDFSMLKTIERKSFHDNIAAEIFQELGWNYVSQF